MQVIQKVKLKFMWLNKIVIEQNIKIQQEKDWPYSHVIQIILKLKQMILLYLRVLALLNNKATIF